MFHRPKVSRAILALMCAMSFIMYLDHVNLSAAAGLISDDLHLSNTHVGLVFAAFAYTYTSCQVIGGWVSDRFGLVVDHTGSWTLPFAGSFGLLAVGIVATFFMRPDIPLDTVTAPVTEAGLTPRVSSL